jgi:hypothetical protein
MRLIDRIKHFKKLNNLPADFDSKWYYQAYSDVSASGKDAGVHYIKYGQNEGRQASPVRLTHSEIFILDQMIKETSGISSEVDATNWNLEEIYIIDGKSSGKKYEIIKKALNSNIKSISYLYLKQSNNIDINIVNENRLILNYEIYNYNIVSDILLTLNELYSPLQIIPDNKKIISYLSRKSNIKYVIHYG